MQQKVVTLELLSQKKRVEENQKQVINMQQDLRELPKVAKYRRDSCLLSTLIVHSYSRKLHIKSINLG